MIDIDGALAIAERAVALGSDLALRRGPGQTTAKRDRDMVTELDLAIEAEVREFLARETPEFGFLGEEGGAVGEHSVKWVLDPLDGTANLTHGLPLCAVSLALVEDDRTVVGAIALPFLGARYRAALGGGAFRDGERISCSTTDRLADAMVALGDYAVGDDADRRNEARLAVTAALAARVQRVRMLGSAAIDLAWVADGTLDASVMLSNKAWDTSAGVLVAREAGAVVTDVHGVEHGVASGSTVAVGAGLAESVLGVLADAV